MVCACSKRQGVGCRVGVFFCASCVCVCNIKKMAKVSLALAADGVVMPAVAVVTVVAVVDANGLGVIKGLCVPCELRSARRQVWLVG